MYLLEGGLIFEYMDWVIREMPLVLGASGTLKLQQYPEFRQ